MTPTPPPCTYRTVFGGCMVLPGYECERLISHHQCPVVSMKKTKQSKEVVS